MPLARQLRILYVGCPDGLLAERKPEPSPVTRGAEDHARRVQTASLPFTRVEARPVGTGRGPALPHPLLEARPPAPTACRPTGPSGVSRDRRQTPPRRSKGESASQTQESLESYGDCAYWHLVLLNRNRPIRPPDSNS